MRADYLPIEQYKPIMKRMQYDNRLCMELMLETGLRIDDALSIKTDSLKGTTIHYTAKKTGKAGSAKISASLAKKLKKNSSKEWLFPSPYNGGKKHKTRQAVFIDLKKSMIEDIKMGNITSNISPHSTRKTFAVNERKKGGLERAQASLQHADISTTLLYALSDLDMEKTGNLDVEALAGKVAERVFALIMPEIRSLFVDLKSTIG